MATSLPDEIGFPESHENLDWRKPGNEMPHEFLHAIVIAEAISVKTDFPFFLFFAGWWEDIPSAAR
jgi:hypothetical protein